MGKGEAESPDRGYGTDRLCDLLHRKRADDAGWAHYRQINSGKGRITYKELLKHNSINCSSVLLRREDALAFPMEHDDSHEDYITWLRILRKGGFAAGINRPYLKYRLSEGGKSRNKLKSAAMTYQVYRYVGYGPLKSLFFFVSYALHGIWKYR